MIAGCRDGGFISKFQALERNPFILVDHRQTKRSLLRGLLMIVMLALMAALVVLGVFMLSRIACDTPPIRHSGHVLPQSHSAQIDELPR